MHMVSASTYKKRSYVQVLHMVVSVKYNKPNIHMLHFPEKGTHSRSNLHPHRPSEGKHTPKRVLHEWMLASCQPTPQVHPPDRSTGAGRYCVRQRPAGAQKAGIPGIIGASRSTGYVSHKKHDMTSKRHSQLEAAGPKDIIANTDTHTRVITRTLAEAHAHREAHLQRHARTHTHRDTQNTEDTCAGRKKKEKQTDSQRLARRHCAHGGVH